MTRNYSSKVELKKTREELEAEIDAFFKNGGEVEEIPQGKTNVTPKIFLKSGMGDK